MQVGADSADEEVAGAAPVQQPADADDAVRAFGGMANRPYTLCATSRTSRVG